MSSRGEGEEMLVSRWEVRYWSHGGTEVTVWYVDDQLGVTRLRVYQNKAAERLAAFLEPWRRIGQVGQALLRTTDHTSLASRTWHDLFWVAEGSTPRNRSFAHRTALYRRLGYPPDGTDWQPAKLRRHR